MIDTSMDSLEWLSKHLATRGDYLLREVVSRYGRSARARWVLRAATPRN